MRYKAVLFDLDGTLADTIKDLGTSMNAALALHNLPGYSIEAYKMLVGSGWENLVSGALGEKAQDLALVKSVRAEFAAHHDKHYLDFTKPYEGITELLDNLIKAGVKLAVVTNKRQYMAENVVTQLFGERITVIHGPDGTKPVKPDPYMALLAMKALSVSPQECLFVGDTSVDIITGKNTGINTAGVLWGFRTEKELRDHGADYICTVPSELEHIILND